MQENYSTQHCIYLIDVVANLVADFTKSALFGSKSELDIDKVHHNLDQYYEPQIVEHFIEVINKFGEAYLPEDDD